VPTTYILAAKSIDPKNCFKTVRNASREANAMAIANKQVVVATDNSESGSYRTRAGVFPALTESEPWLYEFVLSRFLHAKRYPLRSKTL
jgi:hypothetical protein